MQELIIIFLALSVVIAFGFFIVEVLVDSHYKEKYPESPLEVWSRMRDNHHNKPSGYKS